MTPRQRLVARTWPWLLALVVLLPLLRPGFVLSYDMVFVPDLALRPDFLGLGSGLPRAVPSDGLVAVLDEVVPGMVLQKLLLLGALGLGGAGAGRLVPGAGLTGRLAATTLFLWNPYVAERLVMGHWTVLLAYGALPWVVLQARRARLEERLPPALVLLLALGATSASGGLMTAVAALAFGADLGSRRSGWTTVRLLACAVAINAPWLVAGIQHSAQAVGDATGVRAFAAHPEGAVPAVVAVLGLGGIWNADVAPASHLGVLGWVWPGLLLGVCLLGARSWRRVVDARTAVGAVLCGGVGLVLALAGLAIPAGVVWLVTHVPGAGLVRDGPRYLGLLAVVMVPLFGHGAEALAGLVRDRSARRALATGVLLAPVALLPDLAWGAMGRLSPVGYPSSYAQAARLAAAWKEHHRGDVLVLPFTAYRAPSWNGGRKVLDPLGRYLPVDYLASDRLSVSGRTLAGEDPRGRRVLRLLGSGTARSRARDLRRLGVGLVVLDETAPGAATSRYAAPVAGRPLMDGPGLRVLALRGPVRLRGPGEGTVAALGAAWLALAGAAGSAGFAAVRNVFRRFPTHR